jgi:DNA-binding SARP family transcriptional activator/tetratricopeptide (TPR) repeat protein
VEFRLFGEVELRADGARVDLGTPRQQTVLAVLLVDAGRPVAVETLIDRVWDDAPPAEARNILYSHLSRIRRLLKQAGTAHIERRHAGYVLELDPGVVDLHRFRQLVERGRDAEPADTARTLAEALDLWRGPPLASIPGGWAAEVRAHWQRRRLDAVVRWAGAEVALGRPDAVIAALPELAAEFPLVEPIEAVLMRALHAAGRDAEAVDRYRLLRERLADQLGTDPSTELRELHQAILRGERPPEPPTTAPAAPATVPAQLPPDLAGFTGRDDELRRLDDLRDGAVAVSGTAGVGKTALAVHWAHRVRDRFPGGQLYVNLRGFDPTGSPVSPAEAVRGFLDAFAVAPERLPAGFEAQVGLYRSLLAGRRVLVVLDNARDAEQVRPLLPGAADCLAVVTSRTQLSGLVAGGAVPLVLDLPDDAEAGALLAGRLGAARVAAEPGAVADIVAMCARLPLALAVVAARAAAHPRFDLAVLAGELRTARGGLDEFAGTDPATDPRAVFSWSYFQLGAGAQRMFRLLGLHDGPDISVAAAASLAGVPVPMARRLLAELATTHLAAERLPGRYACHDLLRAYAAEQACHTDGEADRRAAVRRVLGHYLHSADEADRLLNPHRDAPPAPPPLPEGAEPVRLPDRERALEWFTAEHAVLVAAVRGATGFDAEVWRLVWALRRVLAFQGHWQDAIDVLGVALAAARRLDDPAKQSFAHCYLGLALSRFRRHDDARAHLEAAVDLAREVGDRAGEAFARLYHALLLERQDRHRAALPHARAALDLFLAAGHRAGQAKALNAIGWFHAMLGDHEEALAHCRQALEVQRELGDQVGLAETWDSLGYVHRGLGRHDRAVASYRAAAELYRELDDRYNEATSLTSLGHAQLAAGDAGGAADAWRRAVELLDQLGHPDAAAARELAGSVGPSGFRS